jgi:hypothetical protein
MGERHDDVTDKEVLMELAKITHDKDTICLATPFG